MSLARAAAPALVAKDIDKAKECCCAFPGKLVPAAEGFGNYLSIWLKRLDFPSKSEFSGTSDFPG